jgi:aromatic-L-amino-acid/L-tryptophan decarboxylase
MKPEEFKQWGYKFVDWVADYMAHPEKLPVLSQVKPGSVRQELPSTPPQTGESLDAVLHDLDRVIVPGLTHWNHPSFFAYFPNSGSEPGIFGEMLTAAFNVNGMLWKTSPAASELEAHVLDWLRQMLGLPDTFMGIVYDTASVSTFHALVAARHAVTGVNVRDDGLSGPTAPRLRMYASEQAHSSVEKDAIAIGIGRRGLVKIGVDDKFRMDVAELESAIERDLKEGLRPFCVVATIGTTSTTSIDPVASIADVCRKHGLWLHVDAAYAGAAAILPEMTHILEGVDRADSFIMNPHKWLLTPMDFSAFYCRRPEVLKASLSLVPDYLRTAEGDGGATNYMDYGIQLGRRFRALKLWMVIRYYGVEGLQAIIREHIRLGQLFSDLVKADPRFEVVAPAPFSTVCFRLRGGDDANQALLDQVNASGKIYLSHTRLHDKFVIRFSIGNMRTTEEHVRAAWMLIATMSTDSIA